MGVGEVGGGGGGGAQARKEELYSSHCQCYYFEKK